MAWLLFPIVLGAFAVLQGTLNRRVAELWGLAPTVALNTGVFLVASMLMWFAVRSSPDRFPPIFRDRLDPSSFSWWFLLPGILGFALVAGIPWAIAKLGALQVFVGIVAAQMMVSVLWDAKFEQIPLTGSRVAGALLAIGAVVLVNRD